MNGTSKRPFWLAVAAVQAMVCVAFWVVERASPLHFSSLGDAQPYFLPLIKAQTDSWLAGEPLRMIWGVGSGWSPWESGQVGPLYPLYLLSNLLARALGQPLSLLEVSAFLHLSLVALFALWWLPRRLQPATRAGLALLLALQPAAWVLGANWHPYLALAPWFVLLLLTLLEVAEAGDWTRALRARVLVGSVGFFMTAHPQMYALGMVLLAGFRLSLDRDLRRGLEDSARLVVFQLPLVPGLLALYARSLNATADWMSARQDPLFLAQGALRWSVFLLGTLTGSAVDASGLQEWGGITNAQNCVALFAPWTLLALWISWRRRDAVFPALLLAVALVISARSFPWMGKLALGPLAGFRWPWKLSVLVAPLTLCACLRPVPWSPRLSRAALAASFVVAAGALCMSVGSASVNFMPSTELGQPRGVLSTAEQTRRALAALGIQPGERIAILGKASLLAQSLPGPLVGLSGNGPLLYGIETAHTYEPLEDREVSRSHGGLSPPWRVAVDVEEYLAHPESVELAQSELGVDWLLTRHLVPFQRGGWLQTQDDLGRALYARRLARTVPSFPYGDAEGRRITLARADDGSLVSESGLSAPPLVKIGRSLSWTREADGRYRGTLPRIPRGPLLGTLLCTLAAIVLERWLARPRPSVQRAASTGLPASSR